MAIGAIGGTAMMKTWMTLQFRMVIGIASFGLLAASCLAQTDTPTVEEILKVWNGRQEKVTAARFELNTWRTIHEGSYSLIVPSRPGQPEDPNPPQDITIQGTEASALSVRKCVTRPRDNNGT